MSLLRVSTEPVFNNIKAGSQRFYPMKKGIVEKNCDFGAGPAHVLY
jgi:hypothetical protein